jgi:hypothetical protein
MKDKGTETVTAVCATQAGGGDRIQHDFNKNQFTPVPNYTQTLARSIAVEAVKPGTPAVRAPPILAGWPSPTVSRRRRAREHHCAPRSGCRFAKLRAVIDRQFVCQSRKLHVSVAGVELSLDVSES